MITMNASNFRAELYKTLEQTISYNVPVTVTTKNGNAILLSEQDYRDIMETLYLESVPGLADHILAAASEPEDEAVPASEVEW